MDFSFGFGIPTQQNGGASAFIPSSLFASSEGGAWYDPSDLSTLWQDTAGTTPVTADGQSVARMDDKSGNGNHLVQATAGARPVYKTDGTLHWLQSDGVDDIMSVATGTPLSPTMYIGAGASYASGSSASSDRIAGFEPSVTDHFRMSLRQSIGRIRVETRSGTLGIAFVRSDSDSGAFPADAAAVVDSVFAVNDNAGYVNGTQVLTTTRANGWSDADSVANSAISIFPGAASAVMKIYQAVMLDRELTADETTNVREYMAEKSGVTL